MLDFGDIELTDEQKASLLSQVEGLKKSKDGILEEKKAEAEKVKELQDRISTAEQFAKEAEIQKLEAQGKYEEAKKLSEEALLKSSAEWESKYNALKQDNEEKAVESVINGLLPKFNDDSHGLVEAYLRSKVKKEYNEQNLLSISLDGKSVEDFISGASEDKNLSNFLKGVNSSGAGISPSSNINGSNLTGGDPIQQRLESRLKAKGLS